MPSPTPMKRSAIGRLAIAQITPPLALPSSLVSDQAGEPDVVERLTCASAF